MKVSLSSCWTFSRFSHALWLFLALAVRLILETEYKVSKSHTWPFQSAQDLFSLFSLMQKHDYNNLTFPVLHWRVWCPPLPPPPPPAHGLRAPTLTITQVFHLLVFKKRYQFDLAPSLFSSHVLCVTHLIFFQVDLPAYSCAYAVWCWSSQSGVAHKVGLLLRCKSASRILWFFWKWKPMANLSGVYIWAASCSSVSLSISSASSSATSSLSTSSTASFKICFAFCWCHRYCVSNKATWYCFPVFLTRNISEFDDGKFVIERSEWYKVFCFLEGDFHVEI